MFGILHICCNEIVANSYRGYISVTELTENYVEVIGNSVVKTETASTFSQLPLGKLET